MPEARNTRNARNNEECPSAKEWKVRLYLSETGGSDTAARLVLDTGDNVLETRAHAHRNPHDAPVPEIGDELAVGRALVAMGQRLIHAAAMDIEGLEAGRPKPER